MGSNDFGTLGEIRGFFENDEFSTKCLGARIDDYDFSTGIATVSMTIDDRHHNAQGYVMGGVIFSLADFALAVASNVGQAPSAAVASHIEFMRRVKGDRLVATATPVKEGSTLAFHTVDVHDGMGRHIARMTVTSMRTDH